LNKPDQSGTTPREHLEQIERQTKKRPQELDGPDFPPAASYLWSAFISLSSARGQGFNGPLPISYTEIKSWMELTNNFLNAWEIEGIKELDRTYLRVANG